MTFTTNRDHLSSALRKCAEVAHKQTMPVLGSVLLRVSGPTLHLSATDLEVGLECQVAIESGRDGSICLPAEHLLACVDVCPNLEVKMEVSDLSAVLKSGSAKFKLHGMDAQEFPPTQKIIGISFSLPEAELAPMLRKVSYAMSNDAHRYILQGVYFEFKDEEFCVVATNGRQLSKAKAKAKAKAKDGGFILPAKAVLLLQKFLGRDKDVTLTFSERAVSFECAAGTIQSKIVEGSYPNYRQVIPKETEHRVKIERELMAECVQRGGLAISENNTSTRFAFTKHILTISSRSSEYGDASADMAIVYDGPEIQIALNIGYLLPVLANLTQDEIEIGLQDELSPFVLTVPDFISIIMPLRQN